LRTTPVSLILKFPPRSFTIASKQELVSPLAQSEASAPHRESVRVRPIPYWQLGVLAAFILYVYAPTLRLLVEQWWNDPNFSHGFFVPLFSAFVIWQERDRLVRLTPQPAWSGLAVIALGLIVFMLGDLGAELFLARSSLLLVLAGTIILFAGWNVFRALLFPWAFLLLMIPIPTILFNQITFPLQLLASKVAAWALPPLGVPCLRLGNIIVVPGHELEVAEACSGIRSLMSLVTLAIIYGYLVDKRVWVRWVLALASVPIAVIANSVRIIGTGLVVYKWGSDWAEGSYHALWGLITFVISLMLLFFTHRVIRWVRPAKGESHA
jgi:exosortase